MKIKQTSNDIEVLMALFNEILRQAAATSAKKLGLVTKNMGPHFQPYVKIKKVFAYARAQLRLDGVLAGGRPKRAPRPKSSSSTDPLLAQYDPFSASHVGGLQAVYTIES